MGIEKLNQQIHAMAWAYLSVRLFLPMFWPCIPGPSRQSSSLMTPAGVPATANRPTSKQHYSRRSLENSDRRERCAQNDGRNSMPLVKPDAAAQYLRMPTETGHVLPNDAPRRRT